MTTAEIDMVKRLATRHVLYEPRQHGAEGASKRRIVAQFNFTFLDAAADGAGAAAASRIITWQHLNMISKLRFIIMMQIAAYYGRLKRGKRVVAPSDDYEEDAMDLDEIMDAEGDSELYFEPLLAQPNAMVVGIRGTVAASRGLTLEDEDAFAKAYATPEIAKKYAKAAEQRAKQGQKKRDRPDPESEDGDAAPRSPKKKRRLEAASGADESPADMIQADVHSVEALADDDVAVADDILDMSREIEAEFEELLSTAHLPSVPLREPVASTPQPRQPARAASYKMWLIRAGKMLDIEMDGIFHRYGRMSKTARIACGTTTLNEPWNTLSHYRSSTYDEIAKRYYQRDGDDTTLIPLPAKRWTVQESFETHLPDDILEEYRNPDNYYDATAPGELAATGPPVPSTWPHPEHIVVLRQRYARFELMLGQPLPFAIGLPLDLSPFATESAVDAMMAANPGLLTNIARGCVSLVDGRDSVMEEARQRVLSGEETDAESRFYQMLVNTHPGFQVREHQAAYALPEAHKNVLLKYTREAKQALFERVLPLERGCVPGVLDPAATPPQARAAAAAAGPIEVRILPPGDDGRVHYQVQHREVAQRHLGDITHGGAVPIENPALLGRYQEAGGGVGGHDAGADGISESDLLMQEALAASSRANLGMGPEIIIGDDFMKKAIINQAAFADLETKCRDDGLSDEETQEKIRQKIDQVGRESLALFWRAETTAPALKAIRQSIQQIMHTKERMACQDLINGSSFQTAIAYLHNTATMQFKMTSLTGLYFQVCYFAAKGPLTLRNFTNGVAPPSIALLGNAMVGKSFILLCTAKLHLPGSMISANHISPQAFQSVPNLSHWIIISHELPQTLMFDNHDTTSGGGKASKDASSATNNAFKSMMTEGTVTSIVLHIDPDTKKRATETRITVASNVIIAAVNWQWEHASGPAKSRMLAFELPATSGSDPAEDARCKKRPASLENDPMFAQIVFEHHALHALYALVRMLLNMHVWPGGVVATGGELLSQLVLRTLEKKGSLPSENFSQRKEDKVLQMAEIVCVWSACFALMATREGQSYLQREKETPFSWKAINGFIAPRLLISKEHVVFALTLLDGQFDDMHSTDVLTVLANLVGVRGKTYTETTPAPLYCRPREMVGGTPDLLEAIGIISPPAPAPVPVAAVEVTPAEPTGTVRTVNTALAARASAAAAAGTPMDTNVPDYRYVTCEFTSRHEFKSKLSEDIKHHLGVTLRPEFIEGLLKKHTEMEKMSLHSPFYKLNDAKTGIEQRKDSAGNTPWARIPAMIIKETQVQRQFGATPKRGEGPIQVSLSVEFLARRLLMPMAEAHEEELSKMLGLETMDDKLRKAYESRMRMAPAKRLEREVFDADPMWTVAQRDEKCHEFGKRIAECDVRAHPMAAAINAVLSHPSLGQTEITSMEKARQLNSSSEIPHPYENYMVAYRVPSIRMRYKKEEELVSLGQFFQRLSIRRTLGDQKSLAIENHVRPSLTAQHQLDQIARVARGPPRPNEATAGIDTWNKTSRYLFNLDPDYIAAVERIRGLGSPMETRIECHWRDTLTLIQDREPLIYPPNRAIINRMLEDEAYKRTHFATDEERLVFKEREELLNQYPARDIGCDLIQRLSIWDDEYKHTRPISDVLIPIPFKAHRAVPKRGPAPIPEVPHGLEAGNLEDDIFELGDPDDTLI